MKRIRILQTATGAACMILALTAAAQTSASETPAPSGASGISATAGKISRHVDDALITTKVKVDLLAAKTVKSEHIHVKTHKGVVSLTGTVPSAEDRDNAKLVAQNVAGVTEVRDHLKIVAR
ncbi:MAG: BON domain-containing protein [Paraburkholderia sp.]|uniref:BON domain-containing protein n=2 Tax=Paraburkholderia sp. TaxID=1926495 RepID=UPI0011F8A933|nr:BON domain-containing protein [Paraburkholderia sp.]TAM30918.1 MAG: BON domain-containing protein [Paraburkholderia sp.]